MISLKYAKEYRTDVVTDASGRNREKYTYVGPLYDYCDSKAVHNRQRIILTAVGVISVILFILGLYFPSNLSRILYVSLPYGVNALILFLYFESLIKFFPYRPSLKREEKEKGGERLRGLLAVSCGLFFLSVLGAALTLISSETVANTYDCVLFICDASLFVSELIGLLAIKNISYTRKPNPESEAADNN